MSNEKCANEEYVSFQLIQSLSVLLRKMGKGFFYEEDPVYDFFGDKTANDCEDWKTVWGEVYPDECLGRWAKGLQAGEPISIHLLVKAIERGDVAHEVQIDKINSRDRFEQYKLKEKIEALEKQLKKEKGPKKKALEKVGKKKKGGK
jgi:hypothetical protein